MIHIISFIKLYKDSFINNRIDYQTKALLDHFIQKTNLHKKELCLFKFILFFAHQIISLLNMVWIMTSSIQ